MNDLVNLFFSVPFYFWVLIAGFIVLIATITMKLKDLEPIRKQAEPISKIPEKMETIKEDVNNLKTSVSNLKTSVSNLDTRVGNLEEDIKDLPDKILEKIDILKVIKNQSPIALNDRGKELSQAIDASAIASKYKDKLARENKTKNSYHIQQSCFNYAANEILKDLEEDPKTYEHIAEIAFENGLQMGALMQIIGLVLRDQVLDAVKQSTENISQDNIKPSDTITKKP